MQSCVPCVMGSSLDGEETLALSSFTVRSYQSSPECTFCTSKNKAGDPITTTVFAISYVSVMTENSNADL